MANLSSQIPCAEILKVLANETRLSIVQQLLSGPRGVGEINDALQLDKTLLSHHLKVLREAGIVEAEREGKCMRYSLSPGVEAARRGPGLDFGCCQLLFNANYLTSLDLAHHDAV